MNCFLGNLKKLNRPGKLIQNFPNQTFFIFDSSRKTKRNNYLSFAELIYKLDLIPGMVSDAGYNDFCVSPGWHQDSIMATNKIMKIKLIYFLILIFWVGSLFSQGYNIKHLSTLDGLNHGTINDISQDSMGYIWFSTWDGLMRYDGYTIKNYKHVLGDSTSLPAKHCRKLFCDSKGNLWVQSGKGVSVYDNSYDNFKNFSFSQEFIIDYVESGNKLFFNTLNKIYYLDPTGKMSDESFKQLEINGLPGNDDINKLLIINSGFILISYSPENSGSNIYFAGLERNKLIIESKITLKDNITAICLDDTSGIFYTTNTGLFKFDFETQKSSLLLKRKFNDPIDILLKDNVGNLWAGSRHGGLIQYSLFQNRIVDYNYNPEIKNSILSDLIFSLYEDFSGNLWIGHGGEGVSIINLNQKQFYSHSYNPFDLNTIRSNTILCFNETDKEILIGTLFSGLEIWNKENNRIDHIRFDSVFNINMREYSVWHICKENNNQFWLATNFGLIRAIKQNDRWHFKRFLEDVDFIAIRYIYIDPRSNMWLGSYNGLYLIPYDKRDKMLFYHYTHTEEPGSLSDRIITSILIDDFNNLWVGTENGGLNLLEKEFYSYNFISDIKPVLKFKHFTAVGQKKDYLNNNEINCLISFSRDQIWIGTQGGGINILNPENFVFTHIKDGLPGTNVFGILKDPSGNYWISTNSGICRYSPGKTTDQFINYKPSDGLPDNVFLVNAFFKSFTGEFYFGTRHGFMVFYPERIKEDVILPKVNFGNLQIKNTEISIGDSVNRRVILPKALSSLQQITLTHKENTFGVEVSVHQYSNPEKNEISFKLDGFDNDWNEQLASRRYIMYSNLMPGTYTLNVLASNSDGLWIKDPIQLKIRILHPWYGTLLFKLVFLTIAVLIILIIMRLLFYRQNLKHSLKLEKLEKQKIEEINEAKLQFFTDISHDLKTPLSLITAPIDSIFNSKNFSEIEVKKHLQIIYKNSHRLLTLIEQLLSFRRLSTGKLNLHAVNQDIVKFIKEVLMGFQGLQNEKNINLTEEYDVNEVIVWFDPLKMEQILYNLFSNAYKFTSYNGNVKINVSVEKKKFPEREIFNEITWVKTSVTNDGIEIPDDKLDKIFERFFQIRENIGGSGIGLSLTKSLVELHHGFIEVSSSPEEGVRFTFYIPKEDVLLNEEEKVHDVKYQLTGKPSSKIIRTSLRQTLSKSLEEKKDLDVLFVEDNSELREFFHTTLDPIYNFYTAPDGKAGLEFAQKNIPDIIISDIMMPEMNGYIFCREIKNNIKTCHIPVILLTARASGEDQIKGYESGADAYVVKPFNMDVLIAQVNRLIKNRQVIQKKFKERSFQINDQDMFCSRDDSFIRLINKHIESNIANFNFNVNTLSELMKLSTTQIYRKIKALTGTPPIEYINNYKIEKSCLMLRESDLSIKEICFNSGFNNPSYFSKSFKQKTGVSPQEYRFRNGEK